MLIYHAELVLEDGFELLEKDKEDRLVRGKRVSSCSGWPLFRHMRGQSIRCWECGCEADRWVVDKGRNDKIGPPVLNLYGLRRGKLVLMNRDHIIPRSLGGTDAVENLRPACEPCNGARGNKVTQADIDFRIANPHLFNQERFEKGKKKAAKHAKRHANDIEGVRAREPFEAMQAIMEAQPVVEPAPPPMHVPRLLVDPGEIEMHMQDTSSRLEYRNIDGHLIGPYIINK